MTPQQICDEINDILTRLFRDADEGATSTLTEVDRLEYKYKRVPLMRKMGLIETVRRGGGPQSPSQYPLHQTPITGTVYRITLRSITLDELRPFLSSQTISPRDTLQ